MMTFGERVYGEVAYGEAPSGGGGSTPTGVLSVVLPKLTANMSGTYTSPAAPVTGALTAALPKLGVAAFGTYGGPIPTDTSNAFDGLDLLLTATVTFAATVTPPPASAAVKYDKAIAYPVPTMVGGRPT